MSKRCKLQKEYYKEFGNYKGSGKYTDHYVNWLESKVLAINYTHCCTELPTKEAKESKKIQLVNYIQKNLNPKVNRTDFRSGFEYCYRWINGDLRI
tara:strand:- start:588 stop:875 length:288 start_codon:yes stop_codon:yes gene_type:complete